MTIQIYSPSLWMCRNSNHKSYLVSIPNFSCSYLKSHSRTILNSQNHNYVCLMSTLSNIQGIWASIILSLVWTPHTLCGWWPSPWKSCTQCSYNTPPSLIHLISLYTMEPFQSRLPFRLSSVWRNSCSEGIKHWLWGSSISVQNGLLWSELLILSDWKLYCEMCLYEPFYYS